MRKLLLVIVLAGITANFAFPRSIDGHDKSGVEESKAYVYTIAKTWNGENIPEEERVSVSLQAVPGTRDIVFRVDAPYHNDPPPEGEAGHPQLGLWNYEVVEIYFLNDADQYLEVEVGPHGHHIVLLLNGQRNTVRHSLPLEIDTSIIGSRWTAKAVIPGDYFPPKISKLNAHSTHGYKENRRHLALYPADGTTKEPDPHNLSFFQPFNISVINPEHQNYHDLSELWEDSIQGIFKYKITRQWNNFRSKIPATTASLQGFQGGVEVNFTMPVNDEKFPAESFVAIFENGQKESLKVQLFVDGHFSVEFFNNRKTKLNQQNFPLDYRVENRIPRFVKGSVMIPPSYFPPKVNLLNMYALFGVETMLAMTLRAMEIRPGIDFTPNLSNIEHFVSIDFDLLVESKDEYSEVWRRLLNLDPLQGHNTDVSDGGEEGVQETTQGPSDGVEETKLMEKDEGREDAEESPSSDQRKETEGLEADSKSDQEGEVAITEAGVSALPDETEAKSEDDVRSSLPAILLGQSITDKKANAFAARAEYDAGKIVRKDQVHFNKPLRFLLRKHQDPTAIEKEDFNPLRELQEHESFKEEEKREIPKDEQGPVEHESVKEEEKREIPKDEQGPVEAQAQDEGSIASHEEKNPELTTVRIEEEDAYTTEKDVLVEEEERLYTKEALMDEEQAPSTAKEEQSPSERPEELAITLKPREEEPAEEGPTEQEEQSTNIEREHHQRRYEESSNRNELPITFKITFEPKIPFEDGKQEVVDASPPEDLPYVDYSLLDEPPPNVIENSGALPPPHPICFIEGLVPDHFRCQVFYECVLEDGLWAVYNWRCKRGTYYDPVKVACIKGYC